MIQVSFKNLEKSDLMLQAIEDRLRPTLFKFGICQENQARVTVEMENSPQQAGADQFRLKIFIKSGRYKGLTMEKSDTHFHGALALAADHLLEALNRSGDKARVKARQQERKWSRFQPENTSNELPLLQYRT